MEKSKCVSTFIHILIHTIQRKTHVGINLGIANHYFFTQKIGCDFCRWHLWTKTNHSLSTLPIWYDLIPSVEVRIEPPGLMTATMHHGTTVPKLQNVSHDNDRSSQVPKNGWPSRNSRYIPIWKILFLNDLGKSFKSSMSMRNEIQFAYSDKLRGGIPIPNGLHSYLQAGI
jgi:hypothetical protein